MVVAAAQQRAKGRAFEIRKGFPRVKGPVVTDDKGGHHHGPLKMFVNFKATLDIICKIL